MSTEAGEGLDDGGVLLQDLIRKELLSIPIGQWGYFFPCHVAVWRFIEARRPGVLGELRAGFDAEPYFKGKGSGWFCGTLGNRGPYLDSLEEIMYPIADGLSQEARARGFLLADEGPAIDLDQVKRLAEIVLSEVDRAVESGLVSS